MPAPIATRNPQPPPQPQHPPQPAAPVVGTWNPEMGIRFGGGPAPAPSGAERAGQQPQGGGVWDPSAGVRFG